MTFLIVTHVSHIVIENQYFAYSPYVREMNIWLKYVDKVIIVAPKSKEKKTPIHIRYEHNNIQFIEIAAFDIKSKVAFVKTLFHLPNIMFKIFLAMYKANHIHLRCPGNVGLLATLAQIFFPFKTKTAKYAGNWDPKSKQPATYNIQKCILNNTFLTRNMQVLVYGEWEGSSQNIKPFFTATYYESEKVVVNPKCINKTVKIVFVGTLTSGKRPLYAIQLVQRLLESGLSTVLSLYGEGNQRELLENYIIENNIQQSVFLQGNQSLDTIKKAYQENHFVILPSQSEGWPKAIAEGMFWGCVPLSTSVSCIPYMLDKGNRGLLLHLDLNKDVVAIQELVGNSIKFNAIVTRGIEWPREFTLDKFEREIKLLLKA
jgi:glycosyltransferase involved in cell wall biosynthesis